MSSKITFGKNIESLKAQRFLANSSSRLNRTYEQLSSGQRINRGSDDAAGLALSSRLRTDSRVFGQAIRNLNDGISLLNTAEGTLRNLTDVTVRLKELTTQAANGTYSLVQRQSLNTQANSLVNEFNRQLSTTRFNGLNILDGSRTSYGFQGGYGSVGQTLVSLSAELRRTVGNGTLQNSVQYDMGAATLGGYQNDLTTGDFNRDGKLDTAAIVDPDGGGGNILRVYYGNGQGGVSSESDLDFGAATTGFTVKSADLNKDGVLDLVVGENGTSVSIFYGKSSGGFNSAVEYTVGSNPIALGVSDFNGDGHLDIAAANNSSSTVSILLGNGSGSFTAGTSISVGAGTNPYDMTIGDFNGDSISDLATVNLTSQTVSVFIGDGQGKFTAGSKISGFSNAYTINSGDFNEDGRDDLVIGDNGVGGVQVMLATGNGNFSSKVSNALGGTYYNASNVLVNDLNGDGHLDLGFSDGTVTNIFTGKGSGSFNAATTYDPSGLSALSSGDFNGDGSIDIVGGPIGGSVLEFLFANNQNTNTISSININSAQKARETLNQIETILTRLSNELGNIGASQSRLTQALGVLGKTRDQIQSAESRIKDIDVARSTAELVKEQTIQQMGTAILAQANQQPLIALQLLEL